MLVRNIYVKWDGCGCNNIEVWVGFGFYYLEGFDVFREKKKVL